MDGGVDREGQIGGGGVDVRRKGKGVMEKNSKTEREWD